MAADCSETHEDRRCAAARRTGGARARRARRAGAGPRRSADQGRRRRCESRGHAAATRFLSFAGRARRRTPGSKCRARSSRSAPASRSSKSAMRSARCSQGGGYAEYCRVDAGQVLPIPGSLDMIAGRVACRKRCSPCGATCSGSVACSRARLCSCTAARAASAWRRSSSRRRWGIPCSQRRARTTSVVSAKASVRGARSTTRPTTSSPRSPRRLAVAA